MALGKFFVHGKKQSGRFTCCAFPLLLDLHGQTKASILSAMLFPCLHFLNNEEHTCSSSLSRHFTCYAVSLPLFV